MEMKFAQVVNKGMQRDYAMNTASQEFAYENKNIRITTTGDESFLSISNEKSTKEVQYKLESIVDHYLYEVLYPTFGYPSTYVRFNSVEHVTLVEISGTYYENGDPTTEPIPFEPFIYKVIPGSPTVDVVAKINLPTEHVINYVHCEALPGYTFVFTYDEMVDFKNYFFANTVIKGCCTLNDYIVIFVTKDKYDFILRGKIEEDIIKFYILYYGDLKLQEGIECTTVYESDDVQKVYWVDGINQPRVINICKLKQSEYTTNIDFVPKIEGNIKVSVEKQYEGRGVFPSGVIQYYITYYNKFGQESNAVHITPLYNLSPSDRGGNEDETQTCSFKIRIEDVDLKYDNIRIYSLIRTSLDTTPTVSIVGDLTINKYNSEQYYEIIDDNYGNINVAPSDILFLGGNTITASTIEQKDNTLFLGNISSIANNDDYTDLKEKLKTNRESGEDGISFVSRPIADKETSNADYGYSPNMDSSSKDRGFKYLEYYRFGLQFQSETGEWGNTLWLNDKQNPLRPNIVKYDETEDTIIHEMYDKADNFHSLAAVKFKPTDNIKKAIKNYNSKYYRLVMAEHNDLSRTIKTQGIVMPTVFNLKQRYDNTLFGMPAWSTGMFTNKEHYQNVDNNNVVQQSENNWVIQNSPMQQLSSAAYSLLESEGVKSEILPSATRKYSIGQENSLFLSYVLVTINVQRCTPASMKIWNSPHGNYVVQDIFTVEIKPYVKNYTQYKEIAKKTYTIREFRLAGKRKKTYDYLFSLIATKTWRDYENGTNEDILGIDFIELNEPIIYLNELPSVSEFHKSAKQNDYTRYIKIYRNGSPGKNSELVAEFENNYFIDANTCNMWTPNINNLQNNNLNFRVLGNVIVENTMSDYIITLQQNVFSGKTYNSYEGNFNRYKYKDVNVGISSFPLWPTEDNCLLWTYTWGQNTIGKGDGVDFKIKDKTFANLWKTSTSFLEESEITKYENIDYNLYSDNTLYISESLYNGKYQNVMFPKNTRSIYLTGKEQPLSTTTDFKIINSLIEENSNVATYTEDYYAKDSINIKYSSTPHLVFNLGVKDGYVNVLPNYKMTTKDYHGRMDITNNNVYPANILNAYYRFYVGDDGDTKLSEYLMKYKPEKITLNYKFPNSSDLSYLSVGLILPTGGGDIHLRFDTKNFEKLESQELEVGMNVLYENHLLEIASIRDSSDNYYDYTAEFKVHYLKEGDLISSTKTLWIVENEDVHIISDDDIALTGITTGIENENTKLFLGEFYTDYDPSTFMGGNTENALEQNTFIPISDATPIGETIYGFEGDTYYQQWDCLRIYPTSEEDTNKVVDIVSVMLETHENLDGDTRKARGRADVVNVRPDNMVNQINPVYSQSNNYVTSKILDEKFEDSTHPTQYWWSLTKVPNSDIDTWTGINLTSVAELDGDKGFLNKIKRWNNQLFAFQDRAIAMINFNNQTTIATQEGIPVEIANSGKVNGHYYITTNNGCKNKWSIVESPAGLYFIDSYNKSINVIGDGIKSLSQLNLFQDWIEQKEQGNIWNPLRTHNAFKGFYDPIHKEVYFANGEDCICYNELLEQFTSFYDYEKMNYMFLVGNHIYSIPSSNKLYLMFEGNDYCNLYDKQCNYYMQYKINNEPFIDKTWTNLEYRADIFNRGNIQTNEFDTNAVLANETFDSLKVWNEYQNGELDLNKISFGYLRGAKPKFRIWRTNLPRANKLTDTNKFGLDRMRNPWIMLELRKSADSETSTNKRMEFHDLIVKYVI